MQYRTKEKTRAPSRTPGPFGPIHEKVPPLSERAGSRASARRVSIKTVSQILCLFFCAEKIIPYFSLRARRRSVFLIKKQPLIPISRPSSAPHPPYSFHFPPLPKIPLLIFQRPAILRSSPSAVSGNGASHFLPPAETALFISRRFPLKSAQKYRFPMKRETVFFISPVMPADAPRRARSPPPPWGRLPPPRFQRCRGRNTSRRSPASSR